jgi:uncharacterized protein (DUF433 family)
MRARFRTGDVSETTIKDVPFDGEREGPHGVRLVPLDATALERVGGDKLKSGFIMPYPPFTYIEERNGGLYVAGTGVSVDSVVIRFQQGASPEKIVQSFPTLKLAQVYGVIAYYLENERLVSDYVAEGERELEQSAVPLSLTNPDLFARLEAARRQIALKRT